MKTTTEKHSLRPNAVLIAVSACLAIFVEKNARSQPERVDLLRVIRIRFVQRHPMHPSAWQKPPVPQLMCARKNGMRCVSVADEITN